MTVRNLSPATQQSYLKRDIEVQPVFWSLPDRLGDRADVVGIARDGAQSRAGLTDRVITYKSFALSGLTASSYTEGATDE